MTGSVLQCLECGLAVGIQCPACLLKEERVAAPRDPVAAHIIERLLNQRPWSSELIGAASSYASNKEPQNDTT